jgi:hypothetical protein
MCIRWLVVTPCNYVGVYWDQICYHSISHPTQIFEDPILGSPFEEGNEQTAPFQDHHQTPSQCSAMPLATSSQQHNQSRSQQQAGQAEPQSPTQRSESRQSSLSTRNNSLIPPDESSQTQESSTTKAEKLDTLPPFGRSGYRTPADTRAWRTGMVNSLPRYLVGNPQTWEEYYRRDQETLRLQSYRSKPLWI